jgi:hypothetical protein
MVEKLFQDKNKIVWVRLNDFNYPRTALYLLGKTLSGTRISACDASKEKN